MTKDFAHVCRGSWYERSYQAKVYHLPWVEVRRPKSLWARSWDAVKRSRIAVTAAALGLLVIALTLISLLVR